MHHLVSKIFYLKRKMPSEAHEPTHKIKFEKNTSIKIMFLFCSKLTKLSFLHN